VRNHGATSSTITGNVLAVLLALEALVDYPYTAQAEHALGQAVTLGRAERFLAGHTNIVGGVAWSPDGKQVATASSDQTVRIWDVATGGAVVAGGAMAAIGLSGWYKYDFNLYNDANSYVIVCDGGVDADDRYTYGVNFVENSVAELMDQWENKLEIKPAPISELWLYDSAGINVIKKWPLRDKTDLPGTVTLTPVPVGTVVNRETRVL
jgi:hypothetical protein